MVRVQPDVMTMGDRPRTMTTTINVVYGVSIGTHRTYTRILPSYLPGFRPKPSAATTCLYASYAVIHTHTHEHIRFEALVPRTRTHTLAIALVRQLIT